MVSLLSKMTVIQELVTKKTPVSLSLVLTAISGPVHRDNGQPLQPHIQRATGRTVTRARPRVAVTITWKSGKQDVKRTACC